VLPFEHIDSASMRDRGAGPRLRLRLRPKAWRCPPSIVPSAAPLGFSLTSTDERRRASARIKAKARPGLIHRQGAHTQSAPLFVWWSTNWLVVHPVELVVTGEDQVSGPRPILEQPLILSHRITVLEPSWGYGVCWRRSTSTKPWPKPAERL